MAKVAVTIVTVKSKVKISQNVVAFSEYPNFTKLDFYYKIITLLWHVLAEICLNVGSRNSKLSTIALQW